MPFTSFRDRLSSSSKQDREGPLLVRAPTHASDAETSTTGSGSSNTNTTAAYHSQLEALKKHPLSADPAQFIQDAITPMFTYNPKHDVLSLDDIEEYHMPRYFAPHYKYMLNCDELNTRGRLFFLFRIGFRQQPVAEAGLIRPCFRHVHGHAEHRQTTR
jgi:hypothetical protein